jgi:hypothetical protein
LCRQLNLLRPPQSAFALNAIIPEVQANRVILR